VRRVVPELVHLESVRERRRAVPPLLHRRRQPWCCLSRLRLIDSCITQLNAQGPCRTCNESKEEEEGFRFQVFGVHIDIRRHRQGEVAVRTPLESRVGNSNEVTPDIDRIRCRANLAHLRQSRPDSGLDIQVKSPQNLSSQSTLRSEVNLAQLRQSSGAQLRQSR